MIPYKVFPMFHHGPIRFNMYGVMFAVGLLIANTLAARGGIERGFYKNVVYDLTFRIFIGSLIGARMFYLLFFLPEHVPLRFWTIFKIWEGGLALIRGFAGGIAAAFIYAHRHLLRFWTTMADIYTLPLIVGHIFGRIGDYLTGGHPGKVTNVPWSIFLNGANRHPVVLYEIVGLLIICSLVTSLKRIFRTEGTILLVYVQLYAIQRTILDFFRIESTDPRTLGLTSTQYAVLVTFIVATTLILVKGSRVIVEAAEGSKNYLHLPLESETDSYDPADSRVEESTDGKETP